MRDLTTAETCFYLTRDIARNSLAFVKRRLWNKRRRFQDTVRAEYDQGQWQRLLDEKAWQRYGSIRDYICRQQDGQERVCLVQGSPRKAASREYYEARMLWLRDIIMRYAAGTMEEIVEIGAGAGYNLFSLHAAGVPFRRFLGLDISKNALDAGRETAGYFGIPSISFERINLLDGGSSGFNRLRGKTIFTYYCLEQVHRHLDAVIDNLIEAGPERVVHIEPTREILRLDSLLDVNSMIYSHAMDYPSNILATLRHFEGKGRLALEAVERLNYAPTLRHYPVLAVWRPVGNQRRAMS